METIINGIRVGYTDEGRGVPLLFVHGFPLSRGAWQKQTDEFRSNYRVIAPDLCGFGASAARTGVTTMIRFANDIHGLLQQLHTGPVILIGHSMGGYVALAFVRQYPELVRGLVLVSTKAGADTTEAAAGRRAMAERVQGEGVEVVIKAMLPKLLAADNHDAAMAEQVRGFMASATPAGVSGALLGMAERPDMTASLAQIAVPTLVVTGAADTLIPPTESETLARAVASSQCNTIANAGHLVAFEQPVKFNHVLDEWLDRMAFTSAT